MNRKRRTLWAPLCAVLLVLSGCNVAGVLGSRVVGQWTPAVYTPAKDQPMLVIAESYRSGALATIDTDQLTRYVTDEISRYQIAPTLDPAVAIDLRTQNPAAFSKLTISEIGRRFGAKQVLYINLMESTVESNVSESMRGTGEVRIKVVDANTSDLLFPTDLAAGYPVSAKTPQTDGRSGATPESVRQSLQRELAVQIVRTFRKWEAQEDPN